MHSELGSAPRSSLPPTVPAHSCFCVNLCRSVHLFLAKGSAVPRETLRFGELLMFPLICAAERHKGKRIQGKRHTHEHTFSR